MLLSGAGPRGCQKSLENERTNDSLFQVKLSEYFVHLFCSAEWICFSALDEGDGDGLVGRLSFQTRQPNRAWLGGFGWGLNSVSLRCFSPTFTAKESFLSREFAFSRTSRLTGHWGESLSIIEGECREDGEVVSCYGLNPRWRWCFAWS